MVLQQHGQDDERGRDAGAATDGLFVQGRVGLVIDEHVAHLGEARVERIGGDEGRPRLGFDRRQIGAAAHHRDRLQG